MEILIYTSQGCVWCSRMKELMERADQEYTEILYQSMSGDDQEKFRNEFPDASSFPVAIIDGEYIGGLVPVAKLFLEKGLVSANKNV
jgi:glutaredoxin 3